MFSLRICFELELAAFSAVFRENKILTVNNINSLLNWHLNFPCIYRKAPHLPVKSIGCAGFPGSLKND
jgi:hypothetical protein